MNDKLKENYSYDISELDNKVFTPDEIIKSIQDTTLKEIKLYLKNTNIIKKEYSNLMIDIEKINSHRIDIKSMYMYFKKIEKPKKFSIIYQVWKFILDQEYYKIELIDDAIESKIKILINEVLELEIYFNRKSFYHIRKISNYNIEFIKNLEELTILKINDKSFIMLMEDENKETFSLISNPSIPIDFLKKVLLKKRIILVWIN